MHLQPSTKRIESILAILNILLNKLIEFFSVLLMQTFLFQQLALASQPALIG